MFWSNGNGRRWWLVSAFAVLLSGPAGAQDPTLLRINEIMASNKKTPPVDDKGKYNDMLEIYNPTDVQISLKGLTLSNGVVEDPPGSGTLVPAPAPASFKFQTGSILPKGFVLIFCDGKADAPIDLENSQHASFKLSAMGELVALFTSDNKIIDQVNFPRMGDDISYGRYPDAANNICYLSAPSFKKRPITSGGSLTAGNPPCGNVPPEPNLHSFQSLSQASDVNPDPSEPMSIYASVWDDKDDVYATGSIVYRVNDGPENTVAMENQGPDVDDPHHKAIWSGTIPGQSAGAEVKFYIKGQDAEGLTGTDPVLCAPGQVTNCNLPYQYRVGYHYGGPLILNEVCPLNGTLIRDVTDGVYEDYIEIYNSDPVATVPLDGLSLTSSPFHPSGWLFPTGATILPGEHLLVWCDSDSSKTDVTLKDYHTDFKLDNVLGEAVFLFDTAANGLGYIDGYIFSPSGSDQAYSRVPDGLSTSPFILQRGTPKLTNGNSSVKTFIRGDVDGNGLVEINDPITLLNYLFLAGSPLPCKDAADFDDLGTLEVTDAVNILDYMFLAGPAPQPPFPSAGADPTPATTLGCGS